MPRVVFTSSYDSVGNRTGFTDNFNGLRAYTYDARNWLTRITESGAGVAPKRVDFAYDDAGRRTSLTRLADLAGTQLVMTTLYAHDQADRLTSLTHNDSGGATLALYAYTLDAASRLAQEARTWKTAGVPDTDTLDYTYTNDDQLIGVAHTNALFTNETYSYDANGNRTMTGYVTGVGNRLTSDGTFNYTYDLEGNLTVKTAIGTGDQTLYSWDHRNRLTQVDALPSGGTLTTLATFRYDALDRRIRVEDASGVRWTAYDGIEPTLDFDGAGVLSARRLHGPNVDEVLARETASGVAWYLKDRLGTVRDVVDNTGTQVAQTFYDSYGQVVAQFGTGGDRFQYTGREWDSSIDLQYNRARYNDPAMGRWTAEDPSSFAAGDANLYRYVDSHVTGRIDPSGLRSESTQLPPVPGSGFPYHLYPIKTETVPLTIQEREYVNKIVSLIQAAVDHGRISNKQDEAMLRSIVTTLRKIHYAKYVSEANDDARTDGKVIKLNPWRFFILTPDFALKTLIHEGYHATYEKGKSDDQVKKYPNFRIDPASGMPMTPEHHAEHVAEHLERPIRQNNPAYNDFLINDYYRMKEWKVIDLKKYKVKRK